MLRIILIRPGATAFDAEGRIQGTLDIPLSPDGQAEVERMITPLAENRLECLYAPDCEPCQGTARQLAQALGVRVKRLEQMQNVDHGLWQGLRIDDVKRKQPTVYREWREHPDNICPPRGEMLVEARARVERALQRLLRKHPQGTIGLVLSEPLASVARQALIDCELGDLWRAGAEHGRWEVIEVEAPAFSRTAP